MAATAALCGISLGIQYGFAAAAARRSNSQRLDFGFQSGEVTSSYKPAQATTLAIVSAVFVVAINGLIRRAVARFSRGCQWSTLSGADAFVAGLLAVAYLINSLLLPLAAALLTDSHAWYLRGGVAEIAFYIQLGNAALPPLLQLLSPYRWFRTYCVSCFVRTQDRMDQVLAVPPFPVAQQLARCLATVGLAVLWSPAMPASLLLALAGLALQYGADQLDALRRAPPPAAAVLGGKFISHLLLRILPAAQLALMWRLFLAGFPGATAAFWAGAAVWGLFCVAALFRRYHSTAARSSSSDGDEPLSRKLRHAAQPSGYVPQVPLACSDVFAAQLRRLYALPKQLSAAAAASPGGRASITARAGPPAAQRLHQRSTSSLSSGGRASPQAAHGLEMTATAATASQSGVDSPLRSAMGPLQGRYDPHTPPQTRPPVSVYDAGDAYGAESAWQPPSPNWIPNAGTPSAAYYSPSADDTPSAPMLPPGSLPSALGSGWHGDDAAVTPEQNSPEKSVTAWRRNGAYEAVEKDSPCNTGGKTGAGGGSPLKAGRKAVQPMPFGSYVSPEDEAAAGGTETAAADDVRDASGKRHVHFACGGAGAEDPPSAQGAAAGTALPKPWPPALAVDDRSHSGAGGSPVGRNLSLNDSSTSPRGGGNVNSSGASSSGGGRGSPVYAPPPVASRTPKRNTHVSAAPQSGYLRAHLDAAAAAARQRRARQESEAASGQHPHVYR